MIIIRNIFLIAISFLSLNFGCKEKSTEPIKEDIKPSKRDFVWTVDTLFYHPGGQTLLQSLWGSSPTNVYAVGHDAHAGISTMWHYDGKNWDRVGLVPFYGGNIEGPFDLRAVYGFDSTNIYAVGNRIYQTFSDKPPYFLDSSFIIHFDGIQWNEVRLKRNNIALVNINASSPTNIWCSGNGEYIYRYDGVSWVADTIPLKNKSASDYSIYNTISAHKDGSLLLSTTIFYGNNGSFSYFLFQKNNLEWQAIDSFKNVDEPKWGPTKFWNDNEETIYSAGTAIYRYSGNKWHVLYRPQHSLTNLWGTDKNNIFALAIFGHVYHFNGLDWKELNIPSWGGIAFYGVWGTKDEIFLSAHDGNKTYMFHGK